MSNFSVYNPMASRVLFIDENYIKQNTELSQNIDAKLIIASIQYAQDKYISQILGSAEFEYLKMAITAHTLTSDDTKLLNEFVQPCACALTMYELLPKLLFQFKNASIITSEPENSKAATRGDIIWLAEKYQEMGAWYAQRMTQFLIANPSTYTLYYNPSIGSTNGAEIIYPNRTSYNCGLHFPNNGAGTCTQGWGLSLRISEIWGMQGNGGW